MNEFIKVEKDYRKWISFNNLLGDFQKLYDLYTSVDTQQNKGGVSIDIYQSDNGTRFVINQEGNDTSLEIEGEPNRVNFLEYLVQHYLPNNEIDKWYLSKKEEADKSQNHLTAKAYTYNGISKNETRDWKIHPKETKYYNFRVFFSLLAYLGILGLIFSAFYDSVISGLMITVIVISTAVSILILGNIAQGFFIGLMKGNSVKLNENQYPEVFNIVKNQSKEIGLKERPDIYISHGHFNAFVTKFARKKYLMLYSEVIETALKGDYEVLKFVVGHELGHLKRQHLNKEVWLAPSLLIPFLKQAHSRGCEYTCDRIGHYFSKQGSFEGILILTTGKEIFSKINIQRYIVDANSESDFWTWLSEKFLSHPHIYKRLSAINNYSEKGY